MDNMPALWLEFWVRFFRKEKSDYLGIKEVRINKYSSLLSAYGIALADVVAEAQLPLGALLKEGWLRKMLSFMTGIVLR